MPGIRRNPPVQEPEPKKIVLPPQCQCNHENLRETRYLTIEQLRDTLMLAIAGYAMKTFIDVAGTVAINATTHKIQ